MDVAKAPYDGSIGLVESIPVGCFMEADKNLCAAAENKRNLSFDQFGVLFLHSSLLGHSPILFLDGLDVLADGGI